MKGWLTCLHERVLTVSMKEGKLRIATGQISALVCEIWGREGEEAHWCHSAVLHITKNRVFPD